MRPAKMPADGWPWMAKNYSFQLGDWPPGFVSQIELDRSAALSASSTAARERQLAQGKAGFAEGIQFGAGVASIDAKKASMRGGE